MRKDSLHFVCALIENASIQPETFSEKKLMILIADDMKIAHARPHAVVGDSFFLYNLKTEEETLFIILNKS